MDDDLTDTLDALVYQLGVATLAPGDPKLGQAAGPPAVIDAGRVRWQLEPRRHELVDFLSRLARLRVFPRHDRRRISSVADDIRRFSTSAPHDAILVLCHAAQYTRQTRISEALSIELARTALQLQRDMHADAGPTVRDR